MDKKIFILKKDKKPFQRRKKPKYSLDDKETEKIINEIFEINTNEDIYALMRNKVNE